MKKLFLIFITFFTLSLTSCDDIIRILSTNDDPKIEVTDSNQVMGMSMMNTFEKDFTKLQFDSVCRVEKISNKLKDWHVFVSKDAETKETFQEYMYIKSVGKNEAIYRLIITNNNYRLTKRIIRE